MEGNPRLLWGHVVKLSKPVLLFHAAGFRAMLVPSVHGGAGSCAACRRLAYLNAVMLLAGGASQPSLILYSLKVQSTVPVLSSIPHVKLPEV